MLSANITMLQIVANGLGELRDTMVFVGGAVTELYINNPAASDIRSTLDIDCVIELSSRMDFVKLEENLRLKGFRNDISKGVPICRWLYEDIKVDVMPTDENILGFSNKWYKEGIENKIAKTLPDGTKIFVFPPEYFIAAKFEAHKSRGGEDLRQSHDFEDIIYILDNYPGILNEIKRANASVKVYLKEQYLKLYRNANLLEGIESSLPYGSDSNRVEIVVDIIRDIAEMDIAD